MEHIHVKVQISASSQPTRFLAWRIPGTEEPGGLLLCGRTELDTTDVT